MRKYKLINNCIGWAVFLVASIVYLMTAEPTASWWDCGEYIATTNKLEVGHPPGAPTFQLIGRLFALLAGNDVSKVALMINSMSAICSGLTILFLFWTITLLSKKFVPLENREKMTTAQMIAVFGSGIVGALAYTFSDTFWFSAVEGEVYAMSSCFTAIVFWAILKWDEQAEDSHNLRWLVLIAFLIGVAIGVHLLNILTIPAITYIIYFKKYPQTTKKGLILTGIVSLLVVAMVMYFIIPEIVNIASYFEAFFVNSIGLPFNSGTIVYFILLFGLIIYGLYWTKKKVKPIFNTAILSVLFLILGYSTFATLIIRANANTPINENAPKDAVSLLTYLNREQYGTVPLLYGPYYTAQVKRSSDGGADYNLSTKYVKDRAIGKYKKIKRAFSSKWDDKGCTIFPRMYSTDEGRRHIQYYKMWIGKSEDDYSKPSFVQNLTYFFRYQVNHMYWRYFMWNFVGRQNDIQSYGLNYESSPAEASNGQKDLVHGNWISGIKFLDAIRLGPQSGLPSDLQNNEGRNTLYFLPLLLGLAGLIYQIKRNGKSAFVVFLLFFMTGLAIVLYLNQSPCQPRERDYAYAGSFYAFAIWIGMGVFAICDWLKKIRLNESLKNLFVIVICLFAVPVLMAWQEWDDHDRSDRYMARDFAKNYLESCKPNSILITFGDNDTFPLWYDQEVEGIRTDVRVLNYTLSGMAWYVEQLYNKIYDSEKVRFTLDKSFYGLGQDINWIHASRDTMELEVALKNIKKLSSEQPPFNYMSHMKDYEYISVLPTNNFRITFNKEKLAEQGIYPNDSVDGRPGEFVFSIPVQQLDEQGFYQYAQLARQELMLLDIIASNHFERPIYVINPYLLKDVIPNIMDYVIQEGMVYRIVPYRQNRTYTDNTYGLFMDKFSWGNVNKQGVYLENAVTVSNSKSARQNMSMYAMHLIDKGMKKEALNILNKAIKEFPMTKLPYDRADILLAQAYCKVGDRHAGKQVYKSIIDYYKGYIHYYNRFSGKKARCVEGDKNMAIVILAQLYREVKNNGFEDLMEDIKKVPNVDGYVSSMEFSEKYGSMINSINETAGQLSDATHKSEAILKFLEILNGIEQNAEKMYNSEMKEQIVQIVQFIYSISQKNNALEIIERINKSNVLSMYLTTTQTQQTNIGMIQ
ncbi:MAG: protein O-mannosyl-transferase family [Bacteroidales bacterium]